MIARTLGAGALLAVSIVPGTHAARRVSLATARASDPVVLTGAQVPALEGQLPPRIVAFRVAGGRWHQIPVQVDQRAPVDLGNAYGTPFGVIEDVYTDPNTFVGADPVPTLDADDEIALMASDSGARARRRIGRPAGVRRSPAVALRLRNPVGGQVGYVYLFVAREARLNPAAGRAYVHYGFHLLRAGRYAQSGGNPEDSTITTPFYSRHFSDRWIDDGLKIFAGGASGVNILDRHTNQFAPGVCGRSEDTFSAGEGAFIVNKSGPVRAIREYIGANSGPLSERDHIYYARSEQIVSHLRVHPIPGILDLFDYSMAAFGMRYSNSLGGSGATIDGHPDNVSAGPLAWEQVSGRQGTLTIAHSVSTDIAGLTSTSFYLDQANPTTSTDMLCTGDHLALGASGPWIRQAIPQTDPRRAPHNNLSLTSTLFFDPPGATARQAATHAVDAAHPLQAFVSSVP